MKINMFRPTRNLLTTLNRVKECRAVHASSQILSEITDYESVITDEYKRGPAEGRAIYLDAQATTPVDPRVLDKMMPYLIAYYGNPHSRTHMYGWETETAVEHARKEHKCVLDSCRALEAEGFEVTYIPVKSNGLIDLNQLEDAIRPTTSLVSIMLVNNEIGVRQPIEEIGAICRKKKVFFHTDAAQAVGKVPVDVNAMNIDLMSISGHKIYGPKGVGALYVRRRPRVRVEPIQSGGGQERGMRSGTVPAPLAVGLGAACELSQTEMEYDHKYITMLSNHLIETITSNLPHVIRNGDAVAWYPGCVNLSFAYVEGESLLMALKNIALSSGSACTSASLEPSYVLRAIGTSEDLAHSSIRFGIGRFTTMEEIDFTAKNTIQHVQRLREMSPLWEMVQEGIDLKTIKWTQH
ncbi:nfs1 cysteine desulfurase isoform X3 [Megachile rotundata]|uniref:nfs1 cysteine desulfurase isoform X3 n=1 Tax=Megachile rotundata TaxID=143995 RepID=UPI000614CF82|nr:PREDICTED: probable cysteine desulfurase, mitochondrial isoform X3 [Megachile rotundata]